MAVLNLRTVPADLMMRLRVAAATRGVKLHQFCIEVLEEAVRGEALPTLYGGVRGGGMAASLSAPPAALKPSSFDVDIT